MHMSLQYAREVLDTEIKALSQVRDRLGDSFVNAIDAMEQCTGRVVTSGMGKAGQIATKISATLASTGTPSFFLHPAEALHGDLGMVRTEDVVLMFSNSGESSEIAELLPFLSGMGVTVIGVTASDRSSLAAHCDITILLGDLTEACPLGMAPTATTTVMLAIGDALALCLMKRRGFNVQDYASLHPAGALGKKTLPVRSVMRTGHAVAAIGPDCAVQDVILAITQAKTGAAVVVDDDNKVLGIFADGDLRRGLQEDPSFLVRKVCDVMTANCACVLGDLRVDEVLAMLKEKRIGEVPVIDADEKFIGMADLKGLVSL
ncbi:MAG: KpsF/GutQ family sugar-phosphate isomerase [Phycisphaerales bacterium]|jgi:arabinose-5-phosphate isomerase|nr:KpsF/GutQ family sugar-phosphate isomerase [Phycisphaerales bacterium]